MVDPEKSIPEQCIEHKHQCGNIEDLKKENVRIWDKVGAFMPSRTLLWIIGGITTLFLGMFGFSIQMNRSAIDGSVARHVSQKRTIEKIVDTQNNVLVEIRGIKGTLHEIEGDVQELKRR